MYFWRPTLAFVIILTALSPIEYVIAETPPPSAGSQTPSTKPTGQGVSAPAAGKISASKVLIESMPNVQGVLGGRIEFSPEAFPILAEHTETELQAALAGARSIKCSACGGNGKITKKTVRPVEGFMATPSVTKKEIECKECEGLGDIYGEGFTKRIMFLVDCLSHIRRTGLAPAMFSTAEARLRAAVSDRRALAMLSPLWAQEKDRYPKGQPVVLYGRTGEKCEAGGWAYLEMRTMKKPIRKDFDDTGDAIIIAGTARESFVPVSQNVIVAGLLVGKWKPVVPAKPGVSAQPEDLCKLLGVLGGSLIRVEWRGRAETVRLIGIRYLSPEAAGYESETAALKDSASGRILQLVFPNPLQPTRDHQGALEAYVFVDGKCVNAEMARLGWADSEFREPWPLPGTLPTVSDNPSGQSIPVVLAVLGVAAQ